MNSILLIIAGAASLSIAVYLWYSVMFPEKF
jgi:hypothetical protein